MESTTVPVRKKAFNVRLYPNVTQRELINRTVGCARFVYNHYHYLALRMSTYRETDKDLTTLKKTDDTACLAEVDKFAFQQSLRDLEKAYQNFFRAVKPVGKPDFRTSRRSEPVGPTVRSSRTATSRWTTGD